jgi:thioredoxin reductase (NADPH)
LQSVAAEPPKPRAVVVGHRWDAACGDLRHFLTRNHRERHSTPMR